MKGRERLVERGEILGVAGNSADGVDQLGLARKHAAVPAGRYTPAWLRAATER